jgi:hypothetical protein
MTISASAVKPSGRQWGPLRCDKLLMVGKAAVAHTALLAAVRLTLDG